MNQQPVSWWQSCLACCSPSRVRRRFLRQALYKRLTVEELERRYQQQQGRLRVEEDQALQQAIEKFKKGWYVDAQEAYHLGTFYIPFSPFFTFLMWTCTVLATRMFFFPLTFLLLRGLCVKDNPSLCIAITALFFYPLLLPFDILATLCNVMVWFLVVLPCLLQLEIILFFGGLCYYACGRRRKIPGVFVLNWKLKLIVAQQSATKDYGTVRHTVILTKCDMGANLFLPHASLCRSIFCNPFHRVFKGLNWLQYGYGNLKDQRQISSREIQIYHLRVKQNAALHEKAKQLA